MPADTTYCRVGSILEGSERVAWVMVTNAIRPNGLQVASGNEAVF